MKKLLFNNKKDLDYQLSRDLIGILKSDTDKFGKANILFSGGTTPAGMFSELVKIPFDWSNISIGLVDDRIVPLHHELSNASMLCNNLLDKLYITHGEYWGAYWPGATRNAYISFEYQF